MLRRLPIVVAAIVASFVAVQPAKAASCAAIVAEGRGSDEAKASARSLKHLTFKINRWAARSGYTSVSVGKSSTICSPKGVLVHCKATKKVCA